MLMLLLWRQTLATSGQVTAATTARNSSNSQQQPTAANNGCCVFTRPDQHVLRVLNPLVMKDAVDVQRIQPRQIELSQPGQQIDRHLAVGETVILPHPPSPFGRCFNMDGEGVSVE